MVLGVCLLPLPKPQTSPNQTETAEPLTGKQVLVPTVNSFVVQGCLNPQFLESLKKPPVTLLIKYIKSPHKTFWTQFNLRHLLLYQKLCCVTGDRLAL